MGWQHELHDLIFSGGIKKGGTWGGVQCANYLDFDTFLLETVLWCVLTVILYFGLDIPKIASNISTQTTNLLATQGPRSFWVYVDNLVMAVHFGMLLQVLYYKINLRSLVNLLQPCHLALLLGGIAILWKGKYGTLIAIIILPLAIGAVSALAVPATEGLDQPFEEISFFIQHYVLLVTPLYLVSRNHFLICKVFSFKCILFANWVIMVVHWWFFSVCENTLYSL